MDQKTLDNYLHAPARLRQALAGLTPADLHATPVAGQWSIHEAVLHIVDADLILTDRAKRIIAQDKPTLPAFDQERFATHLFYAEQSMDDALLLLEINHRQFARVLAKLPESAFGRIGIHSEKGETSLAHIVQGLANHLDHHLQKIVAKRKLIGK